VNKIDYANKKNQLNELEQRLAALESNELKTEKELKAIQEFLKKYLND
jgi:chaperonin cofactor prefoldin